MTDETILNLARGLISGAPVTEEEIITIAGPGLMQKAGQLLRQPALLAALSGFQAPLPPELRRGVRRSFEGLVRALAPYQDLSVQDMHELWDLLLRIKKNGLSCNYLVHTLSVERLPVINGVEGTHPYPSSVVLDKYGRVTSITDGAASSSLDVAETITFMDGSLGGTWWFRRTPSGAGGGPATIYIGDGLTKADGSAYSFRAVVCVINPVPPGETWQIHVYRYVNGAGWTSVTGATATAGAYRIITPTFTLAAGQMLALASISDGDGPSDAQATIRRG